jgi:hypothetical protein
MTFRNGMMGWTGGGGGGSVPWDEVTDKPSTFPPAAHDQAISTITGLQTALDDKQATLVSGTNIKTVGGISVLGSGDIALNSDPWAYVKLANNSTVSTVAFANVSGMSFTALANTIYRVELFGAYQAAATTTGIALALDVPTGAAVIGQVVTNTSATALGGAEQIADATTTGATTGVRAANTNTPISAWWTVSIGATGGTVQLMQRSEIAASNTVLQANLTVMGRRVIA